MRLHRPVGIYLLLAPTLWSLWLASAGQPDRSVFVVFVCGVILMRSAGCIVNDDADRHFDAQVARTRERPLVTGSVSVLEARLLAAACLLIAFALVLMLNTATVLMAFVALALAISYPFMKRWHHLPQAYLGIAFGWAVPMAWVAQNNSFPSAGTWLLYTATICWSIAYDTMYALGDRADDLEAGVKSSAILFGNHAHAWIWLFHAGSLTLLTFTGHLFALGAWFYASVAVAAMLAAHQLWRIRQRTPDAYLNAFTSNAWIGWVIFLGILVEQLPTAA